MNARQPRLVRAPLWTCVLAVLFAPITLKADILVQLLIDPPTTAGGGATSTRSGPGSWQVYAVDDSSFYFGISAFSIKLSATSGTLMGYNRAPEVIYDSDGNGNPVAAGFSNLRQVTGNNTSSLQITGFESPPQRPNSPGDVGVIFFPIGGFGQTVSSFAAKYPNTIIAIPASGSWGNYQPLAVAPYTGTSGTHNWLFIGEGTYSGSAPTLSTLSMNVYKNFSTTFFTDREPSRGIPEPATFMLMCVSALVSLLSRRRRLYSATCLQASASN